MRIHRKGGLNDSTGAAFRGDDRCWPSGTGLAGKTRSQRPGTAPRAASAGQCPPRRSRRFLHRRALTREIRMSVRHRRIEAPILVLLALSLVLLASPAEGRRGPPVAAAAFQL